MPAVNPRTAPAMTPAGRNGQCPSSQTPAKAGSENSNPIDVIRDAHRQPNATGSRGVGAFTKDQISRLGTGCDPEAGRHRTCPLRHKVLAVSLPVCQLPTRAFEKFFTKSFVPKARNLVTTGIRLRKFAIFARRRRLLRPKRIVRDRTIFACSEIDSMRRLWYLLLH